MEHSLICKLNQWAFRVSVVPASHLCGVRFERPLDRRMDLPF
ncbi:MAG: hypothetical protein VX432_03720 [Candidatus Poribacteria bacterium]|nr:hypothetical protein [Candidatus Poribacteria bacterium]